MNYLDTYNVFQIICYIASLLMEVLFCNLAYEIVEGIKNSLAMTTQPFIIPSAYVQF